MVVDGDGNVGIGTTDPSHALNVKATSGDAEVHIQAQGNDGGDAILYFNGSSTNQRKCAIISSNVAPNAYCKQDLHFCMETTDDLSDVDITDSKMVITNAGNVGIGMIDPGAKLDVNGSIRGAYNTDTTSYFGRSAVGYVGHSDWAGFAHLDRNNTSDYALLQNSAGRTIINCKSDQHISFSSGDNTKMRVLANGNVGIGTSDPDEKLHVNGIVKATNLDLDGNVVRSAANITLAANSWAKIADFAGLVTGGHYLISIKWDNSALVGGGTAIWNGGVTYSTYVIGSASVYNTTGDELIKYNAHYHYRTISAFEFVQDSDSSSGSYGQHSIYMKSPQSAIVASGVSVTAYRIG